MVGYENSLDWMWMEVEEYDKSVISPALSYLALFDQNLDPNKISHLFFLKFIIMFREK